MMDNCDTFLLLHVKVIGWCWVVAYRILVSAPDPLGLIRVLN